MATPTIIQYVKSSNTLYPVMANNGVFRLRLPNPALAANCIVVWVTWGGVDSTPTVTDDAGNTYHATTKSFSANGDGMYGFYAYNITAGARVISIKNVSGSSQSYIQAMAIEFNNILTTDPIDGSNGHTATSGTSLTAGSFTPAVSGDLVLQAVFLDFASPAGPWTKGADQNNVSWSLIGADTQDGFAVQWGIQTSHTAINPHITTGTSGGDYVSAGMALKSASAGNTPAAGIRIIGIHHYSQPIDTETAQDIVNPSTIQVPCLGNMLVLVNTSGPNAINITGISDANGTWSQLGTGIDQGAAEELHVWVSPNHTPSAAQAITITYDSITAGDACLLIYDIIGAATTQTGNTSATGGTKATYASTIAGAALTPGAANNLLLFVINQEQQTVISCASSHGTAYFDAIEYDGMPVNGPQNCDQNAGFCHIYNADTTAAIITWTFEDGSKAQGVWAAYGVEIQASSGGPLGSRSRWLGSRSR